MVRRPAVQQRGSARALVVLAIAAIVIVVSVTADTASTKENAGDDSDAVAKAATTENEIDAAAVDSSLDMVVSARRQKPAPDLDVGGKLFSRKCAGCHGPGGKGDGAAARHISPRPSNLTRGVYKIRSTPEGKSPTDDDLFRTITRGIPDTAMPGWMGLSVADRWQLVFFVESLSPSFESNRAEPIVIPEPLPATAEMIEHGRELYEMLQCTQCHGDEGRGDGPNAAGLEDDYGNKIYPFDFSRSAKFKGGSAARDLYRTIHTGLGGTPMKSFAGMLTDRDTWALVHYIRDLRVDAPRPPIVAETDATTFAARTSATEAALADAQRDLAEAREQVRATAEQAAETRALLDGLLDERSAIEREAAERAAAERAEAERLAKEKTDKAAAAKEAKEKKAALAKQARAVFKTRCAACHGYGGKGDGPASGALNPKPRDFTDPAWQKSVSNSHIEKIITKGGPAVGKSGVMPAQADLASQPELVTQLRKIVRGFKK